ncbi:MAG: hypothetical protein IPM79_04390 [Polyangiaceae bacterium]|nr:hypothetical protein [Polyangiaceae bacterium]
MKLRSRAAARWALASGAAAGALALASSPAEAATIAVGPTCSLANAINSANLNASVGGCTAGETGSDLITIPAGTTTFTVPDHFYGAGVALPAPTESVHIQGAGKGVTILERGVFAPDMRALSTDFGGLGTGLTVGLEGITFRNFRTPSDWGGVLAGSFGVYAIDDCAFENNQALDGAVFRTGNSMGITHIVGSDFTNNQSDNNIFVGFVEDRIEGCTFTDNSVTSQHVVFLQTPPAPWPATRVIDSHFSDNTSNGALYFEMYSASAPDGMGGFLPDVDGCTFEDNRLPSTAASLAPALAFANSGFDRLVADSSFQRNHGIAGGAIQHMSNGGDLTVRSSVFRDNRAVEGGAIYAYYNGAIFIDDSLFESNQASSTTAGGTPRGGAIFVDTLPLTITDSAFMGNDVRYARMELDAGSVVPATESGTEGSVTARHLGNAGSVIHHTGGQTIAVSGSCFMGNGAWVLGLNGAGFFSAGGNYWGAADGPGGQLPGGGDPVSSQNVDTSGFLVAPPASTATVDCSQPVMAAPPYQVSYVDGGGSATTVVDYAALAEMVNVDVTSAEGVITLVAVNDALTEGEETVVVTLLDTSTPLSAAFPFYVERAFRDSGLTESATLPIVDDGNGGVECTVASECPDPSECELPTCNLNMCGADFEPAGTPCAEGVCNGDSLCVGCVTSADCDEGEVCDGTNTCVTGAGGMGGGAEGGAGTGGAAGGGGAEPSGGSDQVGGGGGGGADGDSDAGDDEGCCGKCAVPSKDRSHPGTVVAVLLLSALGLRRRAQRTSGRRGAP